ncbi:hypothetical protein CGGC5_v009232 [Colletotrichum fructicola Nara gc5]|uniref:Uncharacterized protein n=1 Tax=Colletotrichum fructicola (strain Nara gc5) TaxID=1213859 RepID=L2GBZ0_COLFN|nr:hypothetical protein CFRS1_v015083 [Colletotrichum fructicola]KAF4483249.1 hypothetical protein CGGC5_v009232 [Colletotrichum fructicola Nara gc5]KAF4883593.1 hypothetical protein CGCFRS4_v013452 [Colletotrichum fructicola]
MGKKQSDSVTTYIERVPTDSVSHEDMVFLAASQREEANLYCYKSPASSAGNCLRATLNRPFVPYNRDESLRFLGEFRQGSANRARGSTEDNLYPSITLVGAHGYGYDTHHKIILDRMLFRQIIKDFELPSMSEEVVQSIHGVFCSFDEVEEQDEITHSPVKSLVVTLSTSKSPMRQSFLSMRVRVVEKQCSITCLLLEGKRHDLCTVVSNILARTVDLDWRHPLAFLVALLRDIGQASEVKRKELDDHIVKIEMETNTCIPPPVEGQPEPLFTKKVCWPEDHYECIGLLHRCNNQLVFATRAVDEEIEAWRQLQGLLEDRNSICNVEGLVNKNIQTTMLNTVKFQLTHTKSRRTQIQGLRDRVAVQIELIHNMTAHKEASQTTMIAIVALIFAPASLIATIFSAGLFATDDHSWTTYIASTVPITLAIFVLGLQFTKLQAMLRQGWKVAVGGWQDVGQQEPRMSV